MPRDEKIPKLDERTEIMIRNCEKVEAEIFELFGEIRKVASPHRNSLEDTVKRAIGEGRRFKQWQMSGRPLDNVRLFQNKEGELLPAGKFRFIRFPVLSLFRKKIGAVGLDGSRIEIWNCDTDDKPIFPLSRIALPDIAETGPIRIEEPLRNDLSLNLEIWRSGLDVFIRAGLKNPVSAVFRIGESVKQLNEAGAGAVWYWQKMIRSGVMVGALPLVLIVLTLVLVPSVMRSNNDTGPARDDIYTQSHSEFDENQILGQKCFKHLCGDPKYVSDTDTVNGA
jgi:hypothetical protein